MTYQSIIEQRGEVSFPEFTGERVYMEPFYKSQGLPAHLARWQQTVDQMLNGIDTDLPIYLMIDQKVVEAGAAQRRPGLHVDGYWCAGETAHGGSPRHGGSPAPALPRHGGAPVRRAPALPPVPRRRMPAMPQKTPTFNPWQAPGCPEILPPSHRSSPARHGGMTAGGWDVVDFSSPEAIILASSISAARGFVGNYSGDIGHGGDCAAINTDHLDIMPMYANRVYAGNVCNLHESLPVETDCERTLVRLNVPGWSPQA